ncbi:MAG: type transporter [Betaproteobacteria bacterium]|nr:type transporter [Betaproteobacteria bacterium]
MSLHLWPTLAWQEIKQRYRRSVLGPFWLTISTALFVAGMGPLYGVLMSQREDEYIYSLAIGFIVWFYIASLITEGCHTFIAADGFVKQTRLPLTVHAMRVVWRNLIVLAHNLVILIPVWAWYQPHLNWSLLSAPFAILIIAVNGIWISLLLGLLSARFRDVPQIVSGLLQLFFFITPILWRSEMLTTYQWILDWNPFFHLIELVRAPLSGRPLPVDSWINVSIMSFAGWGLALACFARYRARIAYWL